MISQENGQQPHLFDAWAQSLESMLRTPSTPSTTSCSDQEPEQEEVQVISLISSSESELNDDDLESVRWITSVDPGRKHCGVVQYDGVHDRFSAGGLLDLMCCCEAKKRNTSWQSNYNTVPQKKINKKPPTVHEMAGQTLKLQHRDPIGFKLFQHMDILAIERQMPTNTAMMVVAGALEVVYGPLTSQGTTIVSPQANKRFWNAAAEATATQICFRPKAGHSKHKTDAKRMGDRILTASEQSRFRKAAERNSAHKRKCPVHQTLFQQKQRKRLKLGLSVEKKMKTTLKYDDILDAALQAIFVFQTQAAIKPENPRAAA